MPATAPALIMFPHAESGRKHYDQRMCVGFVGIESELA